MKTYQKEPHFMRPWPSQDQRPRRSHVGDQEHLEVFIEVSATLVWKLIAMAIQSSQSEKKEEKDTLKEV